MKNYFLIAFVFIVFFYTPKSAISNSYAACDLTYTCLGGNNYLVTITYLADCSGDAPADSITVNFTSSCDTFNTIFYRIGNPLPLYNVCNYGPTCCDSIFPGCKYGLMKYVFQKQITLLPCNNWVISFSGGYRNNSDNLDNPTAQGFYLQTSLNNMIAPCNSSPRFTNYPIAMICPRQNFCYNHGALDPDGDSLVYSLVAPQSSVGVDVSYLSVYSATYPIPSLPPLSIDLITGDICLQCPIKFISTMAVKIEEWRRINGVNTMIGYTVREIQLNTNLNCNNSIPVLAGINLNATQYNPNDTIYSLFVNPRDTIDFNIYAFDASVPAQNLVLSWNVGVPTGSFTVIGNGTPNPVGHFHWEPTTGSNNFPLNFNVNIKDNACPYIGQQTFQYSIYDSATIGINSHNYENTLFDIFPNPANDNLTITYASNIEDDVFAGIYSVEGKLMQSIPIIQRKTEINIATLPKGIYFIKIESSLGIGVKKMIIQ